MRFDSFSRPRPGCLSFRAHRIPLCIVNAVRRAIIAEVDTAAFVFDPCHPDAPSTSVHVKANTSKLTNEILGHRMSLIPIHLVEDELERFKIDPSRFRFSVRVKNKGSAGAGPIDVTSGDIKVTDAFGADVSQVIRDAMFPPHHLTGDHILIVALQPSPTGDGNGDEIAIDAVAVCSNGQEHTRWSPVSLCTHKYVVDDDIADATFDPMIHHSRSQFDSLEAHRCYAKDSQGGPLAVDMAIQCECGLHPEFLFFKALRGLASRIRSLAEGPIIVQEVANTGDQYTWTVLGCDHTIGNLVQVLLYNSHILAENSQRLSYVGYHVPHPLERSMCFKFRVASGVSMTEFLADELGDIADKLDDVSRAWAHPSGLDVIGIREVDAFLANPAAST